MRSLEPCMSSTAAPGRAWRTSLLAGAEQITKDALAATLAGFMPSTQSLERELQELAAIIECTDAEFLPRVSHASNAKFAKLPLAEKQKLLAERGATRREMPRNLTVLRASSRSISQLSLEKATKFIRAVLR